jgi:hypothetical protein
VKFGAAEYLAFGSQFAGAGIFSETIHILNWINAPQPLKGLARAVFSCRAAIVGHSAQLGLALLLFVPLDMRVYSLILLILFLIQLQTFN